IVREIVEEVYGEHSPSLHATVKSLLDRLAEKGYVTFDDSRHAHRFSATIEREDLVGQQLQQMADTHFDGALSPILLALVDRAKLSRKQRQSIRKIIDGMK
ncbi:MAG: BlaI/MecI/CopY family transcriptional regulator, partial [Pirellulales bacterium]|nr:BlaI/MecI/CopY family transcriptional regulator [Pirellulales bacterium]